MRKKYFAGLIALSAALFLNGCAGNALASMQNSSTANALTIENTEYKINDLVPSIFDSIDNFVNVEMTAVESAVLSTGIDLIIKNNTNSELLYGSYYILEVNIDGSWYEVPIVVNGNYAFTAIGYRVAPNSQSSFKTDWEWLYGMLVPGNYRIVKDILDFRDTGDYDKYYLSAEFAID